MNFDKDETPAFPFTGMGLSGMTLRDYFAAKAMQALIGEGEFVPDYTAALSYEWADAMLAERQK